MNDSDLLRGLRERDPAAVRRLSDCYLPSLWRFVYARVQGDRHLAEDVVGEAALALIRAAATDTEIHNPGGWLRTVAVHKVQDHFRAAARVQRLIEGVKHAAPTADEADAPEQQQRLERRAEIREVMDELPEQSRLALEWKYVEKLSVREIAERMDTTEKAVESILFRARRDFRGKIACREKSEDSPRLDRPRSAKRPPKNVEEDDVEEERAPDSEHPDDEDVEAQPEAAQTP